MTKRKQQILDIATELLQTKVFSALSFQDIADKLGISKAAIHRPDGSVVLSTVDMQLPNDVKLG